MSHSVRERLADTARGAVRLAKTVVSFDKSAQDQRGVTEAVAVALLLGLSIVGVAAITFYGGAIIESNQEAVEINQAERAFLNLDERFTQVALGESPRQEIELGIQSDRSNLRTEDAGWMRVEFIDTSNGTSSVVTNVSLGTVEYEREGTKLAYQGGGVWRTDGRGSVMVSEPPIRFENGTLSASVVSVRGNGSVYDSVAVSKAGDNRQAFPNASLPQSNELQSTKVVITVQSEYYEGWAEFWRTKTNALVYENATAETVSVRFLAAPKYISLRNGLTATAGTGQLLLKGNGAYTDSYNSTNGTYSVSQSGNGTVYAAGDVELTGDSKVNGTIRSGGIVEVGNSATVDGDIDWTDNIINSGTVTGSVQEINGVAAITPINGYVQQRVGQIQNDNDNNNTTVISGGTLHVGKGNTQELGEGTYYAEHIHVEGGELVLNTTNGDITVAVRDYIHLEKKGNEFPNVTVVGNGNVTMFVAAKKEVSVSPTGLGNRDVNLNVPKGGSVTVPDQRSFQLRIYSTPSFKATVAGSNNNKARFEGAIYAPGGATGNGYTYVKHANVYGGIVSSNLTLGQNGSVHYDEALDRIRFPLSPTVSRIDYFYVSVHPVQAEAAERAK